MTLTHSLRQSDIVDYRAAYFAAKNIKHSVEHFNTANNSLYKLQKDFVYFVSQRIGVWAIVRSLRSHKSQCLSGCLTQVCQEDSIFIFLTQISDSSSSAFSQLCTNWSLQFIVLLIYHTSHAQAMIKEVIV